MKKLLILTLSALLVLGLATVSMAAATFSGEIDIAIQGWKQTDSGSTTNTPFQYLGSTKSYLSDYAFGKMVLNGKLGDDLTGTLVFKDADNTYSTSIANNMSALAVDEASLTFTEDWGTLKLGYFGWNNNLKDILSVWTDDIKSQTTIAFSTKLSDVFNFSLAYALTGTGYGSVHDPWINDGTVYTIGDYDYDTWNYGHDLNTAEAYNNAVGVDLGFTGDMFGGDFLYYCYNKLDQAWGVNAYVKLGDFKPFFEYRRFHSNASNPSNIEPYTLVNSIIGITYEPADSPFYARIEADLNGKGFFASSFSDNGFYGHNPDTLYYFNPNYAYIGNPWGIRLGYKLQNSLKIEAQYFHSGFDSVQYDSVAGFWASYSVPFDKYYLKLICSF